MRTNQHLAEAPLDAQRAAAIQAVLGLAMRAEAALRPGQGEVALRQRVGVVLPFQAVLLNGELDQPYGFGGPADGDLDGAERVEIRRRQVVSVVAGVLDELAGD